MKMTKLNSLEILCKLEQNPTSDDRNIIGTPYKSDDI